MSEYSGMGQGVEEHERRAGERHARRRHMGYMARTPRYMARNSTYGARLQARASHARQRITQAATRI